MDKNYVKQLKKNNKSFKEQKELMLSIGEKFLLNENFGKIQKEYVSQEITLLKTLFTDIDYQKNKQDLQLLNSIYNKVLLKIQELKNEAE